MNTQIITLSSDSTNLQKVTSPYLLDDHTNIEILFDGITESSTPLYLKIDWGDGIVESFDNNIVGSGLDVVNTFNFNPLFLRSYTHEYYPSNNSLYKSLSAQILIKYSNLNESWFILPIKIRTYDYFESIYDLTLVDCNILPLETNGKQFQFITHKDNYLIELRSS